MSKLDNYRIAGGNLPWPDDYKKRTNLLRQIARRWRKNKDFFGCNDLLVCDEGHEVFGRFKSMIEAANAIEKSNPSWWCSGPSITPTPDEDWAQKIDFFFD